MDGSLRGSDPALEVQPPTLRERALAALPTLLVDLVLPYGMFFGLSQAGMPTVWALACGGVVPALRAGYRFVRSRTVDGIALFVVLLFLLGIVLSLITGDPRFALAKESIFTGVL